ncbi:MAG: L-2-hydroxyglutarate oxidase, partial [Planctomycetota bacterium]
NDVLIVGGGILGLASAWQLQRRDPRLRVTVLEKEAAPGRHQSGHNSGVLHSGIYYRPDSLKARNCVAGRLAMVEFCQEHGVAHEVCGKVIVAVQQHELRRLDTLLQRGLANGVRCERISPEQLADLEPHARGVAAIHVHDTGVVDFGAVVATLHRLVVEVGGRVITSARVVGLRDDADEVVARTTAGDFTAAWGINCAGLHADRVAKIAGTPPDIRVVPFRGEFYRLKPEAARLCNHLIYPVPDPALPFLGVHLTRQVHGDIEVGPNAVLALAREGYRRRDVHLGDAFGTVCWPGFWRLAFRHWRAAVAETRRSLSKRAFARAVQRLVPAVRAEDLVPARSGVRAQAVGRDGALIDDFLFKRGKRFLHVCNAPSPAATAALNIGATLADMLRERTGQHTGPMAAGGE